MATKTWIGYSSLTERVFLWKQKSLWKWVWVFTWEKEDITNQFLWICEQYFEVWTSRIISQWEKRTLYISIEDTIEAKKRLIKSLELELIAFNPTE